MLAGLALFSLENKKPYPPGVLQEERAFIFTYNIFSAIMHYIRPYLLFLIQ